MAWMGKACLFFLLGAGLWLTSTPLRAQGGTQLEIPRLEMSLGEIRELPVSGYRQHQVTSRGEVDVEYFPGGQIRIRARSQGRTLLYYWDDAGRHILEILVYAYPQGGLRLDGGEAAEGADLHYRFKITNDRDPVNGWRAPIYEHELGARVPFDGRREWRTLIRAATNPRYFPGPAAAPFSQSTEPTYMLSYYRTPRWTLGAGDVNYDPGELSIQSLAIRGGLLELRDEQDRLQLFGGWARPFFGDGDFAEITPTRLFGYSFDKELISNIYFKNSFVYLDQASAPPLEGTTFQNDFVYSLGFATDPLTRNWSFGAEYGRSRDDNAVRAVAEYRPYWGRLFGSFKRIGTNYPTLAQGFLLKDYQEGIFSAEYFPFRRIGLYADYFYTQYGLSPSSLVQRSVTHSFNLRQRFVQSERTQTYASLSGIFSSGSNDQRQIRGSVGLEKKLQGDSMNLFGEVYGFHRDLSLASGGSSFEETGGGWIAYLRKRFNADLEFFYRNDVQIERFRQDLLFGLQSENFIRTRLAGGPYAVYTRPRWGAGAGVEHNFLFGGDQDSFLLQPYVTASYSPLPALTFTGRSFLNYDLQRQQSFLTVGGEVYYRFGPGAPRGRWPSDKGKAHVEGRIYMDRDGDGEFGPGDTLLGDGGVFMDAKPIPNREGRFSAKVEAGSHRLSFTPPPGMENLEWNDANPRNLDLAPGERSRFDIGLVAPGSDKKDLASLPARAAVGAVFGFVFADRNGNGSMDPAEAPLSGVRLRVGDGEDVSDAEGAYRIDALEDGIYRLLIEPKVRKGLQAEAPTALTVSGGSARLDIPFR